jgi:uncharacterized protein (TIGR03437 family)
MLSFFSTMATPSVAAQSAPPASLAGQRGSTWARWFAAAGLLFAVPYLIALALEHYGFQNASLEVLGTSLLDPKWHNIAECAAAAACVAAGLLFPDFRVAALRRAECAFTRFASHRIQALICAGALPLIVRLALLPVLGIPEPRVHDEFGYLLLADTFASGRLTNPTHPFWRHFEAAYIFHQPTYTAKYPVAPAVLMALAKFLGAHPWLGVWFSAGLMCAAICWMLQGWLSPKWALLGGLLAVCRFTITSSWMNTYWGGVTAAIGGALVLGALPRIMKRQRYRDTLLFALGLGILSQSRPFEGALFSLPAAGLLGFWLLKEKRVAMRVRLTRVALPLAAAIAVLGAATMWYQWRVTGNPLLSPYLHHQRIYGTPQTMYWQSPAPATPAIHHYQDLADVFQWQFKAHEKGFSWSTEGERLGEFWQFFLQPLLTLPLLLLPLVLRNTRMRLVFLCALALLAGNAMYPFFYPHYAAPICGLIILLVVCGMRQLRLLRYRSKRLGAAMVPGLLLAIAVSAAVTNFGNLLRPKYVTFTRTPRGQVLQQLKERGGKHLVLVRYSPQHEFHWGIVYNDADIDRSPVVWAHSLDRGSNQALAKYYAGREVWLFNPDESPVSLVPFGDKPYISAVASGASRHESTPEGVSPGSLAVLLGGNFARDLQGVTNPRPLPRLPVRLLNVSADFGAAFTACESECSSTAAAPPYPLSHAGVTVQFGSIPAPILAVSKLEDQEAMIVQVPFEAPLGETNVTLRAGGTESTKKVTMLRGVPGILQMRMADDGIQAIVLHSDGSLVDPEHPAHRGEVLRTYATGMGPLLPRPQTNQPAPAEGAAEPAQRLIVGVNHEGAVLLSAHYAEGMIGVEEIEFRIPPDVPSGTDIPLELAVVFGRKTVYSNKSSLPVH